MCAIKKYKLLLYILFFSSILGLFVLLYHFYDSIIPDKIVLNEHEQGVLDFGVPMTGEIQTKTVDGEVTHTVNFNNPVAIQAGEQGSYSVQLKLFGLIHYKNINIDVKKQQYVYTGGFPVGIYLKSRGAMVVNTTQFLNEHNELVEPAKNIIQAGDIILEVNHNEVHSKMELMDRIAGSDGNPIVFKILRNEEEIEVKVLPQKSQNGFFQVGIWIRDDAQGIGTITYIDENNRFAALGHGISDVDTGDIFSSQQGMMYYANILSVIKGENGAPGEYVGTIDYNSNNILGRIDNNCESGIYGIITKEEIKQDLLKCEVGSQYSMHKGDAYILSGTDQNIHQYHIRITHIDYNHSMVNKAFEFVVDDEKLMKKTNGIIQGMSGSPILQDGKIVGAVTHVFVNDPTKGFGIFIEDMMP